MGWKYRPCLREATLIPGVVAVTMGDVVGVADVVADVFGVE